MLEELSRSAMLLGEQGVERLKNARVAVFGLGGVGSYAAEALVRSGVGHILAVDNDVVSKSNINRQLIALNSTVGQYKCDVWAQRARDINPSVSLEVRKEFVLADNIDTFNLESYDFVIDAVDTVAAKVAIIKKCKENNIPVISCMGTGNKLDATRLEVTDIYKTKGCPLARVMRTRLKKEGIESLTVVFSTEEPAKIKMQYGDGRTPGSVAFVPSVAGLIAAGEAIKHLSIKED